eukprot:Nitzschia sp. Nitz4//scaffold207_size38617//23074//23979//NITZ4_007678-RA/size38617-processed-gene-0.33-mRNA-1//1//CDS//3329541614//5286//frame0
MLSKSHVFQRACVSLGQKGAHSSSRVSLRRVPNTTAPRRRPLSSLELSSSETAISEELSSVISRHGTGDGVITLNVGGKEFITLRSTVQLNPVLHARVTAAEGNQELVKGAIFIDRDPKHFHLILQHLRNRAEKLKLTCEIVPGSSSSSATSSATTQLMAAKKAILGEKASLLGKKDVLITIPKDKEALRELYVEAKFFDIKELTMLLSSIDWYTRVAGWFSGSSGNPFYMASQAITALRGMLLASSGVGIVLGSQNDELVKNIQGLASDAMKVWRGEKLEDPKKEDKTKKADKVVEKNFS